MLFLLTMSLTLRAETTDVSPKREFRAAWLTTAWGNDWPKTTGSNLGTERTQKTNLGYILDKYEDAKINACFFQVRPMADAFYKSKYEPWSKYLTGQRGVEPTYDPLEYIIQEAHARGIEVHAWINPYRYASSADAYGTLPTDYSQTHPEWLIGTNSQAILNPGIPEVRQRIVDVVIDIVTNYDVDGVVFDDYFYLSGGTTDEVDQLQYEMYNPDGLSRGDWRRQNINTMVAEVYAAIKAIKPWCRFGISPAGVAASDKDVAASHGVTPCPTGSDWQYNDIYSDPLAWLESSSLDYISPQVYWEIGSRTDYSQITPWWATVANHFGRHMYVSHSLSAMKSAPTNAPAMSSVEKVVAATNFYPQEIVEQVLINRSSTKEMAPGSVFFATDKIRQTKGFVEALTSGVYTHEAIVPVITWQAAEEQGLVTDLQLSEQTLSWKYSKTGLRYGIYAIPKAERNNLEALTTAKYYMGMTYNTSFTLDKTISAATHAIAVTVIDRYGNEFAPRFLGETAAQAVIPQLVFPADQADVLLPTTLQWQPVADAASYTVQIATDKLFNNILVTEQTGESYFSLQPYVVIDGTNHYYWRVYANKANAGGKWSETRGFSGKLFSVNQPLDGASEVSLPAKVSWDDAGVGTTYVCQVAKSNTFKTHEIVFADTTSQTSTEVPSQLLSYSQTYYVRVLAQTANLSVVSKTNMFITEYKEMQPPVIIYPLNGATVEASQLQIKLGEIDNDGFKVELSTSPSFPPRTSRRVMLDKNEYVASFTDLEDGLYYARACNYGVLGSTDYSEVVSFHYVHTTGVELPEVLEAYVAGEYLYTSLATEFTVFTLAGNAVYSALSDPGVTQLPRLSDGIYLIKVGEKVLKFIVNTK